MIMLNQTAAKLVTQNLPQKTEYNYFAPVKKPLTYTDEVRELLEPETPHEEAFLKDEEFLRGLNWGKPRFGHPEGKVLYHIREVLDNVDKLNIDTEMRRKLRVITFVHDTFKHLEHRGHPRDWSRHHANLAANFLSDYTDDKLLIEVTRLHDEAYYAWRAIELYHKEETGEARLQNLLNTIGDNLQLYYLFFKCDTQTGDKVQAPVRWFEQKVEGIEIMNF